MFKTVAKIIISGRNAGSVKLNFCYRSNDCKSLGLKKNTTNSYEPVKYSEVGAEFLMPIFIEPLQ